MMRTAIGAFKVNGHLFFTAVCILRGSVLLSTELTFVTLISWSTPKFLYVLSQVPTNVRLPTLK